MRGRKEGRFVSGVGLRPGGFWEIHREGHDDVVSFRRRGCFRMRRLFRKNVWKRPGAAGIILSAGGGKVMKGALEADFFGGKASGRQMAFVPCPGLLAAEDQVFLIGGKIF